MHVIVIGGGITGRLVQWLYPTAVVYDWRTAADGSKLTRLYGANYLWEPIEGLTCHPLSVTTHVDWAPARLDSIRRYKDKIGKGDETPVEWGRQFDLHTTGWDLEGVPSSTITYEARVIYIDVEAQRIGVQFGAAREISDLSYDVLVSTIPQYALYRLLRPERLWPPLPADEWMYRPIYVRVMPVPPDSPVTSSDHLYVNYLSNPDITAYRFTDRNGERHYESLTKFSGLRPQRTLVPGKIYPATSAEYFRARLERFNIYCFGRYATWNPNELVHETVMDIRTRLLTRCL